MISALIDFSGSGCPWRRPAVSLARTLMHTVHLMRNRLGRRLHEIGLHHGQGRILMILTERGPLSQTEIADCCHRRGPTVTHMIQKLEEQGLVARVADPADARARKVSLTPAGRKAASLVKQTWNEMDNTLAAALSARQARQLAGLIDRIRCELGGQDAVKTGGGG